MAGRENRSQGSLDFWDADILLPVKGLSIQIGPFHSIFIDHPDITDARGRKIGGNRRAETSHTCNKDAGIAEFFLSVFTDKRQLT